MTLYSLFKKQLSREIIVCCRQFRLILNGCLFLLMIIAFFPLLMPYDKQLLQTIAPGVIWIAVILAMFLSSERLFIQDYEDGVIEQWLISGHSLSVIILAKVVVFWLFNIASLLILCPIMALLFVFTWQQLACLVASLLVGTPAILCLCALTAAFGASLKQTGALMAIILLPFTIPVMIFGSAVLSSPQQASAYLALLLAFSLIAITCLPGVIACVIRLVLVE